MRNIKTGFVPSIHGFNFINCFPGYPFPPFINALPFLSKFLSRASAMHGLCGGMCFATYDFFALKRRIALEKIVPRPGTPLYRYLYRRQLDTYGAFGRYVGKFALWTALSDGMVQRLTYREFQEVTQQLNVGQPVVLGLVYTSIFKTLAIWLNHQVLAYGYLEDLDTFNIRIYDPNFPCRDDIVIEIKPGPDNFQCEQKVFGLNKKKPVRGFFVIQYAPTKPFKG